MKCVFSHFLITFVTATPLSGSPLGGMNDAPPVTLEFSTDVETGSHFERNDTDQIRTAT